MCNDTLKNKFSTVSRKLPIVMGKVASQNGDIICTRMSLNVLRSIQYPCVVISRNFSQESIFLVRCVTLQVNGQLALTH